MVKKKKDDLFKPKTKDILFALISEAQWLRLLAIQETTSQKLIEFIENEASKKEEELSNFSSIKILAEHIGITQAKISKVLMELYNAIWDLNEAHPELFTHEGSKYKLFFRDRSEMQFATFSLSFTNPVSVGERFEWIFLKGKFCYPYFHIDSIDHEHQKGKIETTITLKNGIYNPYREMLLNKARFLNLLSFDEMLHLPDYKIDELLYHRVEKDLTGFPKTMEKEATYFSKRKRRW